MSKTKKQKLIDALEAKGFEVEDISYTPHNNALWGSEGGWEIHIAERTPLRNCDNPIVAGNYEQAIKIINDARLGIDFCPVCGIGIDHREEIAMFCENCRIDFSSMIKP